MNTIIKYIFVFTLPNDQNLPGSLYAHISQLRRHPIKRYKIFGARKPLLKDIMMEVESTIKSGGSIEFTIQYLDELKATIDDEQIRHDQLFTLQSNQCSAELELRTKDIKDAESVLNRSREQFENCQQSEQKSQTELEQILQNQRTTEDDINILAAIRDSGAQLYANKKQDHVDGLRSLKETFKILDAYQNGISLSQQDSSLVEMSHASLSMIQSLIKLSVTSTLSQVSGILAQMLTQDGGYQEVFERLKQLLTSLEETLYQNLQNYGDQENNSISAFSDRLSHLVAYSDNLKLTDKQLREHISAMSICQEQQQAILESARGKKVRNTEIFDSASRMCNDFQQEYKKATIVRKSEIELVEQVKVTIIERTQDYKANPSF